MRTLFNDNWQFTELPIDYNSMYKDNNPVLFNPDDYYNQIDNQSYKSVTLPHDWMISHVKDLYKNSVGIYKKEFTLSKSDIDDRHIAIAFEGVYMNSSVWINGKKAGEWKYGYGSFEFDISELVHEGINQIFVIAVYQHCNTRWYSGAGIFRDVTLINTPNTFLPSNGSYVVCRPTKENKIFEELRYDDKVPEDSGKWTVEIKTEIVVKKGQNVWVKHVIWDRDNRKIAESNPKNPEKMDDEEIKYLRETVCGMERVCNSNNSVPFVMTNGTELFEISSPTLWDISNPYCYKLTTELIDDKGNILDSFSQNLGFKHALFHNDKGFFLNGRHLKIYGACHHHDHGALGSAFDKNALKRQFIKLQEMGVNSVRCSHNPPPTAWMDLADEMGILVDDESFDMWEKPKTQFDYGNYFNQWCEKDTVNWVRKDRNHPSLIMWSIGNEIYDTHSGNGYEITKKLRDFVLHNDPKQNGLITIASNYMMTDGAQNCASEIDTVGYNYLERLYDEHHEKYPNWKIYGSETSSTVQSRGIYHFPDTLKLVTFSDGQCSTLGNCTTTWGCANTQTVIANDRDCPFSAGQYIWTGWDYIGEPTPYHSKNSYFGQIDTAGFPKDTFYLYKSEWAGKKIKPFVHLLPYWDWNEGQIIDVKAYTNADSVELFFNGNSLGKQEINHIDGKDPFGQWQLEYHKGEIKAVGYDKNGNEIACDIKKSFEDPAKIILEPEKISTGNLFFIDIMTVDKNNTLVENARNYITINVAGDAQLIGLDNGDSTDYEEYVPDNNVTHTRKLFSNRLVAIIRGKTEKSKFVVTAASKDLPNTSVKFDGEKWLEVAPYNAVHYVEDFVPTRKIELIADGSTQMTLSNKKINVEAKIFPENATIKEINWNPVLKECVSSDFIVVKDKKGVGTGIEKATIEASCDGECILRCTAKNGSKLDEVISDLGFTVEGVGNPKLNPYKLIEACRHVNWDRDKQKPVVSMQSSISNRSLGPLWISFDKVDFGTDGSDTIHIPIFSFDTEIPIEIWDGEPGNGTTREQTQNSTTGECLGEYIYKHESVYNIFSENVFILPRRLFGVHTISIVLKTELVFLGFYFDKTLKAISKLRALDANNIIGDSFIKTTDSVEKIGNNVNLDFENMNFEDKKIHKITICGKSNTENNSINIKFFDDNGSTKTDVIEFPYTNDYEEKTFEISEITGYQKVSFIFLPGCNFDFKWFKFSE